MRPKLDEFATLIEMPFSFKKDAITAFPSLDPDFCNPFNETNYLSVCNCIVLTNMVCFLKFAFRLLKISITAQASAENQTKNILQKKCQNSIHV